jgi:hypothetical protein
MISREYLDSLPAYDVVYDWQHQPGQWKECRFTGIRAVNMDAVASGFRYMLLAFMSTAGIGYAEEVYEKDVRLKKIIPRA